MHSKFHLESLKMFHFCFFFFSDIAIFFFLHHSRINIPHLACKYLDHTFQMQIAHFQYQTLNSPSLICFLFSSILLRIFWSSISPQPISVLAVSAALCSAAPRRQCKNLIGRWDLCFSLEIIMCQTNILCLGPSLLHSIHYYVSHSLLHVAQTHSIFLYFLGCLYMYSVCGGCPLLADLLCPFSSLRPFVFKWRLNTNATCMPVFRHHVGLGQASPPNEWLL